MTSSEIKKRLEEMGITNKFALAAILGNIKKESNFRAIEENLNYSSTSNDRIRKIFGSRVARFSDEQLNQIKRNPQEFAEIIYGNQTAIGRSMGNTDSGDGWKYRGRGYIQITGKTNYKRFGDLLKIDLVGNPDLAKDPEIALRIVFHFIVSGIPGGLNRLNSYISLEEAAREVTQVIGGQGLNLNSGYGKELLTKVVTYGKEFL